MKRFQKTYIEIGNLCNLQCSFCPEVSRAKTRMEPMRFEKVLQEVAPYAERICLHVMGEPLSHPDFPAFVEIAGKHAVPLEITTNGTLLQESLEATLLHPTIHQVNFSLQSFPDNFQSSPKTYFQKIFRFSKRALKERPELYINFRLWNLAEKDKIDEKNLFLLEELQAEFGREMNRNVDPRLKKSKRITGRLYLHYDSRFAWPDPKSPFLRARGTCHGTRQQIAILADETVVPCCLDKEGNIPLGSLRTQRLEEILKADRFQAMRLGFEKGELVESLCQRCQFSTRFPLKEANSAQSVSGALR